MSSTAVSVCGARNPDGYPLVCASEPHTGPHYAEAPEVGILGAAWCTPPEPCRGRDCRGPCVGVVEQR